jgi:hypothetical protein
MPSVLTSNVVQGVSFVLFLASLPLISFGASEGQEPLWWTGLALLVIAGLLPPITRFVPLADDDEDDEGEAEAAGEDDADGEADGEADSDADTGSGEKEETT